MSNYNRNQHRAREKRVTEGKGVSVRPMGSPYAKIQDWDGAKRKVGMNLNEVYDEKRTNAENNLHESLKDTAPSKSKGTWGNKVRNQPKYTAHVNLDKAPEGVQKSVARYAVASNGKVAVARNRKPVREAEETITRGNSRSKRKRT